MKKIVYTALAAVAICVIAALFVFFAKSHNAENAYLFIDRDDNLDSVVSKVERVAQPPTMLGFKAQAAFLKYGNRIRTGRYAVEPDMLLLQLLRNLRNHQEEPINLVVPSVRTLNDLAGRIAPKLMVDSLELIQAFADAETHGAWTHETLPCLFIPNTYEVYWDMSAQDFMARMQAEYDRFWTAERRQQADALHLLPTEVATLASIVDSETAYNPEKPTIAGLYLNRLHRDMLLQSDPTVIFATGDFSIRRVLHTHLQFESPYNTYLHKGLPPGPIRIPSVAGLEAVLHAESHQYLYMCAKEDFSGSHNFAVTYAEHQHNAQRYVQALSRRGIRR